MGVFKRAKRKIGFVFSIIAILAIVVAVIIISSLGFSLKDIRQFFFPKDEVYQSMPYGMVKEDQSVIRNASESYDFFLSIKQGEKYFSAIYNFEVWAGVDFGKDSPKKINDSTYMLPYPKILSIDQNDQEKPFILSEYGDLEYNTDIKPVKRAMEKIAKDYARYQSLRDRSADEMLKFISSLDTCYHYVVDSVNRFIHIHEEDSNWFFLNLPHSPAHFEGYTDLLDNISTYVIDTSIYQRYEILFESSNNEPIFTLSYWCEPSWSFEEMSKIMDDYAVYGEWKSIRLVDPVCPNNKMLWFNQNEAYVYVGGIVYHAERFTWNDEDFYQKYMPDVIYLLMNLYDWGIDEKDYDYIRWAEEYDKCIEKINKGYWTDAASSLKKMYRMQGDTCNYNEEYLWSLVSVAGGYKPELVSVNHNDAESYNTILEGYYDIFSGGHSLENSSQFRNELLNEVRNFNMVELDDELERYYCLKCNMDQCDFDYYMDDIIEKANIIDSELINSMDGEQFYRFFNKNLHNVVNEVNNQEFDEQTLNYNFPSEKIECENGNTIYVIKQTLGENDEFGSIKTVIEQIDENGYDVSNDFTSPIIYVFGGEGYFGGRKDAVVFCYNGLLFLAGYDRYLRGGKADRMILYKDIGVTHNASELQIDGSRKIENPYVIKMLEELNKAYMKTDDGRMEKLQNAMKSHIVNVASYHILTVGTTNIEIEEVLEHFKY